MGFKRMILEQSDDEYDEDEPSHTQAFSEGLRDGWESAAKIFPFLLAGLLLFIWWTC